MKKIINKINNKLNNDSFEAKVDIVIDPDHIKNYSIDRKDYTELAMIAIKNDVSVIEYISPTCKDYALLCEEAVNQNVWSFSLINDSVSNYRDLGIKAITKNPVIVNELSKESNHYLFFWELAISINNKVLNDIDEEKTELFPIIVKELQQDPSAIYYINSNIPIYNELCNLAYSINNESTKYMDINHIDKELVFKIISKEPERIENLDPRKEYYKEACKTALRLDGKLINNIWLYDMKDDIDSIFELINIAEKTDPDIADYSNVLYAMSLENRQRKENLLSNPNILILGNNLFELLEEIDEEYKLLRKEYKKSIIEEDNNSKQKQYRDIIDYSNKVKTKSI